MSTRTSTRVPREYPQPSHADLGSQLEGLRDLMIERTDGLNRLMVEKTDGLNRRIDDMAHTVGSLSDRTTNIERILMTGVNVRESSSEEEQDATSEDRFSKLVRILAPILTRIGLVALAFLAGGGATVIAITQLDIFAPLLDAAKQIHDTIKEP